MLQRVKRGNIETAWLGQEFGDLLLRLPGPVSIAREAKLNWKIVFGVC